MTERDICRAAAEAVSLEDLALTVMPLVERAFGSSASCFYRCDGSAQIQQLRGTLGELDEYNAELYRTDPLQAAMRRSNPWISHCVRFPEWSQYTRLPVYEFSLRQDMDDYMILRLSETAHDGPGMVGIMVAHSRRQGPFGDRDERLAARILPSMRALVRRGARHDSIARRATMLETLVEREGLPKLALDSKGSLLWASRRAADLLALGTVPDALVAGARAVASGSPCPSVEVARANREPLRAELSLVRTASDACLVLVELVAPDVSPQLAEVARRARLTASETEVLAFLCLGLTNREIAARRFVSVDTVHTHVGRVLSKLDVHTRAQALLVVRGLKPGN